MLDSCPERPQRLVVLQIPDVVAEEDVALLANAEGVLELAAAGQDVPPEIFGDPQRRRGVASGTADGGGLFLHDPHHAVVGAHVYGPVVDQEEVGDLPDLLSSLLV